MNAELKIPPFNGEAPINYRDFRESIALALHHEGVTKDTINNTLQTVDEAIVQNETHLHWPEELQNTTNKHHTK